MKLVEQAFETEMAEHLGHARNEPVSNVAGNTRNDKSKCKKILKWEFGELPIEVPRGRHGNFDPQLIPKHQTRWSDFDDETTTRFCRPMLRHDRS
jgi:putative transposase